mgnify:CR=1 FL=1
MYRRDQTDSTTPKVIVKRFKLAKDPLRLEESGDEILGQQMEDMLEDCEECILIGCTLGIVMERKIKFYAKVNMTKIYGYGCCGKCLSGRIL